MFADPFEMIGRWGPEKVVLVSDRRSGMRGVLVIDNTARGTGEGGTRMSPTLTVGEVARLARTMTGKWAALDLFRGGAKAGILGGPRSPGKERILRALARALAHEVPRKYVFGLDQLGATVVAASTAAGWVHDPDGLDVDVAASTTARLVIEGANLPTTVAMAWRRLGWWRR